MVVRVYSNIWLKIQSETETVCVVECSFFRSEQIGEVEPQMQKPNAGTDGCIAGIKTAAFAVVVSASELNELHQIVFGSDRPLEAVYGRGIEVIAEVRSDSDLMRIGQIGVPCDAGCAVYR